jgi:hypothetical protein
LFVARYINCVAVAKNEKEIFTLEKKSTIKNGEVIDPFLSEGWIAITISTTKLYQDDLEDLPEKKLKPSPATPSSSANEILIFNLKSSLPIYQQSFSSRVVSLSFCYNSLKKTSELIALTSHSELLSINQFSQEESIKKANEALIGMKIAEVKRSQLPVVVDIMKDPLQDMIPSITRSFVEEKQSLQSQMLVPLQRNTTNNVRNFDFIVLITIHYLCCFVCLGRIG